MSFLTGVKCVSGFPTICCSAIVDLTKETSELDKLRKRLVDIIDEYVFLCSM